VKSPLREVFAKDPERAARGLVHIPMAYVTPLEGA
jgi:hypothetical protein